MISEYIKFVSRTMKPVSETSLSNPEAAAQHMLTGIVTELGELADVLKKHHFYKQTLDMDAFEEEAGDILFYICGLCFLMESHGGPSLESILSHNVAKLTCRYPEGYTDEDAKIRADKS